MRMTEVAERNNTHPNQDILARSALAYPPGMTVISRIHGHSPIRETRIPRETSSPWNPDLPCLDYLARAREYEQPPGLGVESEALVARQIAVAANKKAARSVNDESPRVVN